VRESHPPPEDIHPYDFIAHAGKAAAVSLQKLPLGDPNALRQLLQVANAAEISGGFSNLLRFLGFSLQFGVEKGQREGFEEGDAQQEVSHVLFHTGERMVHSVCSSTQSCWCSTHHSGSRRLYSSGPCLHEVSVCTHHMMYSPNTHNTVTSKLRFIQLLCYRRLSAALHSSCRYPRCN
jgi:hypothetical protein